MFVCHGFRLNSRIKDTQEAAEGHLNPIKPKRGLLLGRNTVFSPNKPHHSVIITQPIYITLFDLWVTQGKEKTKSFCFSLHNVEVYFSRRTIDGVFWTEGDGNQF